jgi:hypothetical protein
MVTWILFNLCIIIFTVNANFQVLLDAGLGNIIVPKSTEHPILLNEIFGHLIIHKVIFYRIIPKSRRPYECALQHFTRPFQSVPS